MATPRRSRVGSVSLAIAVGGAVAAQIALRTVSLHGAMWLRIDGAGGGWRARVSRSRTADAAFTALATSLGNLAARPRTAEQLHWWLERSAQALHESGRRVVPFMLRRKTVRQKIVEAACEY